MLFRLLAMPTKPSLCVAVRIARRIGSIQNVAKPLRCAASGSSHKVGAHGHTLVGK